MVQRAVARIDFEALRNNLRVLDTLAGDSTELCPVIKADGYGHGLETALEAARLEGVTRVAVATGEEAARVRRADESMGILVLGALTPPELEQALEARSEISVWTADFLDLVSTLSTAGGEPVKVHLKYDTGMGRLGSRDPELILSLGEQAERDPGLRLTGLWTHFATADEPDSEFLDHQLDQFEALAGEFKSRHPETILHAANSGAMLTRPRSRLDLVRPGVAVYGMDPFGRDATEHGLRPVLSLHSWVAAVKPIEPGQSVGYGRTWVAEAETSIGTVPIGYGDGFRRALSNSGTVLIRGDHYPVVGTVSMDNITIDLGPDPSVLTGDEVTLIGRDGESSISAEEMAEILDTINYEVTTGITSRVTREVVGKSA